jgi:hypothetical protein
VEPGFQALVILHFVLHADGLIVGLSASQHVIDDAGQFVRRGDDGFQSPEFCAHPPIEVSEIGLAAMTAVMRSAVAARFLTLGQSLSQEANAGAQAKRERSGPISADRVCGTSVGGTEVSNRLLPNPTITYATNP